MKAWLVSEKYGDCATVVFAETRGKAKALAMHTDACMDAAFLDIEVSRVPAIDKYYKDGKTEMDWLDEKDRVALVKEAGFYCVEHFDEECEECSAKDWCRYHERQEVHF